MLSEDGRAYTVPISHLNQTTHIVMSLMLQVGYFIFRLGVLIHIVFPATCTVAFVVFAHDWALVSEQLSTCTLGIFMLDKCLICMIYVVFSMKLFAHTGNCT